MTSKSYPCSVLHRRRPICLFQSTPATRNWGLVPGKYLLIMYDEKWFWGMVCRKGAKACEELGIDAQTMRAYHKSHVNKMMGTAVTGFAFKDNIENDGEAMKLVFFRAQSHKIADKEQRKGVRQLNGKIKFLGEILRRKGDPYLVDCCVTGSNEGTADDPKFPLKKLFQECIFPMVTGLVGPGGKYEGYIPIFQGDNAGPHEDATYKNFVEGHCTRNRWHWEPQGAQMPHINVLDLSVFPMMSRRHSNLSRRQGGMKVLTEDEIWRVTLQVWEEIPCTKIASAYVQAIQIAKRVIKMGGSNDFLAVKGSFSVSIRDDFQQSKDGLQRKDTLVFAAPPASST
jgi:hypothetical protein